MAFRSIPNIGVEQINQHPKQAQPQKEDSASKTDFKAQLNESIGKLGKLKFSGHAIDRLADRGVVLTNDRAERLQKAVDAAQNKGSKDSLVMLDELAFVVSVKNQTVITACDISGLKEGVFTKIDSAVFG